MANIIFRSSSTASIPESTSVKNAPLTNLEIDGNFRSINNDIALRAPINNPVFTGTPSAPTATSGTNTTQLATTAFVASAVTPLAPIDNPTFTGTVSAATITASGTVTALDFNSTSDETLKSNIVKLHHSLINNINPVQFNWKDTGKTSYGVIAQELETIFPELVNINDDGIKSVSYIPMIAMLIAKVQYLENRIEELINK